MKSITYNLLILLYLYILDKQLIQQTMIWLNKNNEYLKELGVLYEPITLPACWWIICCQADRADNGFASGLANNNGVSALVTG